MIEGIPRWLVGLLLGGSAVISCALASTAQAQSVRRAQGQFGMREDFRLARLARSSSATERNHHPTDHYPRFLQFTPALS